MIRQLPRKPRQFSDLFEEYGSGSIARLPKHLNGGLEIHYIAQGHLHWEIEGRPFLVPPRSILFTFPWEKHGSCVDFEPGHFFHFVVFRLKPNDEISPKAIRLADGFGLSSADQTRIFRELLTAPTRCFAASPDFAWTIERLVRELSHPGAMARTHIVALSRTVLCELLNSLRSSKIRNQDNSASERQILCFVDELRVQCSKRWTLASMAAACRLKRTRFETLTKELTGDTPSLLLNRFRVRQTQHFLKKSDKTITAIAFDAGFGSSQYFSKVFKSLTGTTPSQYRHEHGDLNSYDQRFFNALARLKN